MATQLSTVRLLLYIATMLLLQTARQSGAAKEALKWSELTKLCKLANFLRKIPADAMHKLNEQTTALQAAHHAKLAAATAAQAQTDHQLSMIAAATAAAADKCVEEANAQARNIQEKAIKAVALAALQTGRISEFVHLLKSMSAGGATTGFCLTADGTIALTDTKFDDIDCATLTPTLDAEALQYAAQKFTDTGFALVTTGNAKGAGAGNKCIFLHKAATASANAADVFQTTGPHLLAGTLLSVTAHTTTIEATITALDNIAKAGKVATPKQPYDHLYNAVAEFKDTIKHSCGLDEAGVIEGLVNDGSVATQLANMIKTAKPDLPEGEDAKQAEAILAAIAARDNNRAKNIREKILNTKIENVKNGNRVETVISEISSAAERRTGYLLGHNKTRIQLAELSKQLTAARQQKEKSDAPKTQETDESCEKKGTGAECKDG
uniref:Variant surface glycoprotein 1304 n=1 Tax=Trypanosoma brucei TaxID=5691 RepID=M4SZW9_9TRYP|nr:variant surface glycoprotein 1304 [Trypanosoma brucei]